MNSTNKLAFFLLFLVFSSTFSFASLKEWVKIETEDYSIEFPEKPTEASQNLESIIGPLVMDLKMFEVIEFEKDDKYAYGILSTEYPVDVVHSDE